MIQLQPMHRASCHCGAVVLELQLPQGLVEPRRCNCSFCRRRGTLVASVPLSALRVIEGQEWLQCYTFNTETARHYFCSRCGIHTHHQRRSHPDQYAYNVACLEGVDPFALEPVPVYDGIHHPRDQAS
jgi:hypothetical protein